MADEEQIVRRTSNVSCPCSQREEGAGNALGPVCLSVSVSVRTRNSKTIALIDLIFLHR